MVILFLIRCGLILLLSATTGDGKSIIHLADNRLISFSDAGDDSINYNVLKSPPKNSTVVVGDDTILAFHPQDEAESKKKESACPQILKVSQYKENKWKTVTSSSLIPFNSSIWTSRNDGLVYLFGGVDCSGHFSSQLFAYNISSVEFFTPDNGDPPTELIDASVVELDDNKALLVGGKAVDGWIGMNQVALLESDWTFKTVSNKTPLKKIDARTRSLLYPLDDKKKILVFGGTVANRFPEPYMVQLNMDKWEWEPVPISNSISPEEILGGVVINKDKKGSSNLIIINKNGKKSEKRWVPEFIKRDDNKDGLSFQVFDTKTWSKSNTKVTQKSDSGNSGNSGSNSNDNDNDSNDGDSNNDSGDTSDGDSNNDSDDNSNGDSNNDSDGDNDSSSNNNAGSRGGSDSDSTPSQSQKTDGSTKGPSESSSDKASKTSSSTKPTSSSSDDDDNGGHKMSSGKIAALSTVLPVSAIAAVAAAVFFLRKSRKNKVPPRRDLMLSPASFDDSASPNYTGGAGDTGSIESWTAKRDMYERQISNPNRYSFPASISSAATVTRRRVSSNNYNNSKHPLSQKHDSYNNNDDDDRTIHNGDSDDDNNNNNNSNNEHDDYDEDEDLFRNRDVQVLVSSVRRSKLVVTNPDTHNTNSDDENSE